jgi:UDP-N-acetylmuramoyl-tripeptide--D-alanyl-D-alanine ligase
MRGGVRKKRGIDFLLDCYNANPSSMDSALQLLADIAPRRKRVAVLGDMLELGSYTGRLHGRLGRNLARTGVRAAVVVGEHAGRVVAAAREAGMSNGSLRMAGSADDAAALLRGVARKGDTVLLKASRGLQLERVFERF